jgi:hypothetical protein
MQIARFLSGGQMYQGKRIDDFSAFQRKREAAVYKQCSSGR